jgi:hypothetical protein
MRIKRNKIVLFGVEVVVSESSTNKPGMVDDICNLSSGKEKARG